MHLMHLVQKRHGVNGELCAIVAVEFMNSYSVHMYMV